MSDTHYESTKACYSCGTRKRYVIGNACVKCVSVKYSSFERAKSEGKKKYRGKPCKHGHGTVRYVSNRVCVECSRLSRPPRIKRQSVPWESMKQRIRDRVARKRVE
jgi:hypothetical protein